MIIICVYACFNTYLLFPDFNDILSIACADSFGICRISLNSDKSIPRKVITDILPVVLVIIAGVIFVVLFF